MSGTAEMADAPASLIHGGWQAEVLELVVELELADRLAGTSKTVARLAYETGTSAPRLELVLTLAGHLGLFTRTETGAIANNAVSSLLSAGHPHSLRAEARHALSRWARIAWGSLDLAVRAGDSGFRQTTGEELFDYLRRHPRELSDFQRFQAEVTRRNGAALLRSGFAPAGEVVDVGGGRGTLATQLCAALPALRAVVFDLPEVVADSDIPAELAERVRVQGGDFFDRVPAKADVYLLSHILHDWPDEDASRILRTVRAGMADDSTLVILENLKTDPPALLVSYLDVLMLTAWGARERTARDYTGLLAASGLAVRSIETIEPRSALAVITATRD